MSHARSPVFARPTVRLVAGLAAGLTVGLLAAAPVSGQPQPAGQDQPSGEAVVRERTGPEVQVAQGQAPRVLVMFTQAGAQAGGAAATDGQNVEVVLLARDAPVAQGDQPAAPAGEAREIVFPAANARDGTVSHRLDAGGQPRRITVLARRPGEALQVQEVARAADVVVMKVLPGTERMRQMQQQAADRTAQVRQAAEQSAAQAGDQAVAQLATEGDAAQQDAAQQAAAQQPADAADPAAAAPQRTPEQEQAYQTAYQQALQQSMQSAQSAGSTDDGTHALIVVYLGPTMQQ